MTMTVNDVREHFACQLHNKIFTCVNREQSMTSIVGNLTIELNGISFIADEEAIFGKVNYDYVSREHEWYTSMSRNVNDIPGGAPKVWQAIASTDGTINSNYGWCVFSPENGGQYDRVVKELRRNPESRRAVIIYTRPSIWDEYDTDGRSDFICTNVVQYFIRDGMIHAVVQMRSNDANIGFKNDRAWQITVLEKLAGEFNVPVGDLIWQVGSLHVYQRDFYLVHNFFQTGEVNISKADFSKRYPQVLF